MMLNVLLHTASGHGGCRSMADYIWDPSFRYLRLFIDLGLYANHVSALTYFFAQAFPRLI